MIYYLYVNSSLPLSSWMSALSREAVIGNWTRRVNPMGVYSHLSQGEGLVFEIQQILRVSRYRETIERLFHVTPTLKGIFRIDPSLLLKHGDYSGIETMVRIVTILLGLELADTVLLSREHHIVLRRREGALQLNAELDFWKPPRLALFSLPYEFRPLPTPLGE